MGMSFRTLFMLLVLSIGCFVGYSMLSAIGKRNEGLGKLAGIGADASTSQSLDSNAVTLVDVVHVGDSLLQKLVVSGDVDMVAAAIVQAGVYSESGNVSELNAISASLQDRLAYVGESCEVIAVMDATGIPVGNPVPGGMELSGRCTGRTPPGIRNSKTIDLSPIVSMETFRELRGVDGEVALGSKKAGSLGVDWSVPLKDKDSYQDT